MLMDVIKKRRSIRRYKDIPIPKEDMDYILEAGRLSPSGGNEQPWLFGVLDDKVLINGLVKYANNQRWIASAPVVVAICTKRFDDGDLDVERYRLGKLKDQIYDIDPNALDILCAQEHQALIAAENMMLAAAERGIGSCVIAYVDVYKASKFLKVPNSHLVTYFVAFGYADSIPGNKNTKSLDDIVFYNTYEK